jgi:NAD(P)-dependent dehydrogenase (short-subunit alcohol dehydrogenase family)
MEKNLKGKILITGASGLLGKELVNVFLKNDFFVFAQYHNNKLEQKKNLECLYADFSSLKGIRDFLGKNKNRFKPCEYLINNYGPITYKDIVDLESEDFLNDFHNNVITTFEITDFFVKNTSIKSIVTLGFDSIGKIKAYKKILTYACAKNSILLLTKSFAKQYVNICFNIVSLRTLEGASVELKKERKISPEKVAIGIYNKIAGLDKDVF